MINVDFPQGEMKLGEGRVLRLSGNAPFTVTISCFVTDPSPPGFRPCDQCRIHTLSLLEPLEITVDEAFWSNKRGGFQIDISDAVGRQRHMTIGVQSISDERGLAVANA